MVLILYFALFVWSSEVLEVGAGAVYGIRH